MDFGKYLFEQNKKAHSAKRKQKQIQVKEVKFRPGTEEGDYQVKLRNLIRFLTEGDKAKVTMRFRGREMAHQEIGRRLLARVVRTIWRSTRWSSKNPLMEGRQMVMMFAPKRSSTERLGGVSPTTGVTVRKLALERAACQRLAKGS